MQHVEGEVQIDLREYAPSRERRKSKLYIHEKATNSVWSTSFLLEATVNLTKDPISSTHSFMAISDIFLCGAAICILLTAIYKAKNKVIFAPKIKSIQCSLRIYHIINALLYLSILTCMVHLLQHSQHKSSIQCTSIHGILHQMIECNCLPMLWQQLYKLLVILEMNQKKRVQFMVFIVVRMLLSAFISSIIFLINCVYHYHQSIALFSAVINYPMLIF